MPGFSVGVQSASVVALLQRRTIIAIVTVVRARTTARAVAASIPAAAVRTITRRSAAQRWTVRILLLLNLVAILEHRETRLRQVLAPIRDDYTYILIDCPPALDLLTLNALMAADSVLVPIQCEFFALEGISELMDTIDRIRQAFNHPLEVEGILLTMFDDRTNLTRQVAADLKGFFGKQVLETVIPRSVRLAEAPSFGKPILAYDVRSRGSESYIKLAKEILAHGLTLRKVNE